MGIRDNIILTDPWLYIPADDGTVTDIGSNFHSATLSGATDLTVTGIEKGKTALYLNTTGALQSDTLGMNTLGDFSIALYAMMSPIAAWNAYRNLITIGVPGSTSGAAWGGGLGLNGVSGGAPTPVGAAWPSTIYASGPQAPQPVNFWHHFGMIYNATTKVVTCYCDGVSSAGQAMNLTQAAFKVSDHMVLAWTSGQIVVAHIAFWRFQLTVAQMASISGFASSWPPNQDYDTGGGGGGGGGLTTDQDATLTRVDDTTTAMQATQSGQNAALIYISDTVNHIKGVTDQTATDVGNIINSLFPQLGDFLSALGNAINDVRGAVTGTIADGSDIIQRTVGELLSQRNLDSLTPTSYTGESTCSPILAFLEGQRVYGIVLRITAYPPEWEFRTPDQAWSLKDLAVIRIYHHDQLLMRLGVHTIVYTLQPIPQRSVPWIGPLVPLQPEGTVVTVDWAGGVCGELFLLESSA